MKSAIQSGAVNSAFSALFGKYGRHRSSSVRGNRVECSNLKFKFIGNYDSEFSLLQQAASAQLADAITELSRTHSHCDRQRSRAPIERCNNL